MLDVTAFFAGLLGIMLFLLSVNVIADRYRFRISLGAGDNEMTQRKIRAQGNFIEYVPMALILMALCEYGGASKAMLHGLGYMLFLGRLFHAYGLLVGETVAKSRILFRQIGMVATFTVLVMLSVMALGI
ncbi:MAG: MAPEG family protein [Alphaproteobacteria bacterium]